MHNQLLSRVLNNTFFAAYLVILVLTSRYLTASQGSQEPVVLFSTIVFLTYGFIYLLPGLLLTKSVHFVLRRSDKLAARPWSTPVIYAVAVLSIGTTWLLLFADGFIYKIYGFHINGFVINLITTPGGIESMGGSTSSTILFGLMIFALFAGAGFLLWMTRRLTHGRKTHPAKRIYPYLIAAFLVLTLGERMAYGKTLVCRMQCSNVVTRICAASEDRITPGPHFLCGRSQIN